MKARETLIKVLESCNTSAVRGGLQARRGKPVNIYRGAGPQLDLKSGFANPCHSSSAKNVARVTVPYLGA
jgi:hypothetical protein